MIERPTEFSGALLAWYRNCARDLPWRRNQDDAYAIWIAEIMLQQTTVNAVVGFYETWMRRFPTVQALAGASIDDVLRLWSGLGYYTRARNVKKAADEIVARYDGALPESAGELMTLPGIGRYTAGAIASIAYNQNAPILDANVVRVLSRLDGIQGDTKTGPVNARLWRLAADVIPAGNARDFNQALMELGALVCEPRQPNCPRCPVVTWCCAARSGEPEAYPSLAVPKKWRTARHAAVAIGHAGSVLIVKRPDDAALWAGLWELPRTIARDGETLEDCARRAAAETLGVDVEPGRIFASISHVVTNTKIGLTGFEVVLAARPAELSIDVARHAWINESTMHQYAIASPHRKLLSQWFAAQSQAALPL